MEDKELIKNARKPVGDLGHTILDRMNKSHEEMAVWASSYLKINDNDYILDIGCGGGVNLQRFVKKANKGKVCGIDYSDISVEKSRKLNEDAIVKGLVDVQEASVSNLPYQDNTFDIVTAFETVYFWPDFLNDLKEVNRVLKPGGTLLICNEAYIEDEDSIEKYQELVDLLDMKIFSKEELYDNLKKANFDDFKCYIKGDWICTSSLKS
ncbi:class I SAM-dependent methyltransferase [Methanobrevibacter sp. DSM 116169]|uniref:class I SAM-dependent methyltransferase n=1 Tax=Methanobrevibacter sp. DSM 116169 TaxID=3242727 RepID=UPI0038FC6CF8